jgi:hypothetical protein
LDRGGYRVAFGGDSIEDGSCKFKIGKFRQGCDLSKNRTKPIGALPLCAHTPGGSEDDPREQGCPGITGIETEPSSQRGGGIAHACSITCPERRSTYLRSLYVCLSTNGQEAPRPASGERSEVARLRANSG